MVPVTSGTQAMCVSVTDSLPGMFLKVASTRVIAVDILSNLIRRPDEVGWRFPLPAFGSDKRTDLVPLLAIVKA